MTKIRPETAAVMTSWPSFSLSGLDAEVDTVNAPKRIRGRATPPMVPMLKVSMSLTRACWSPVLKHPKAVQTPDPS